MPQEIIQNDQGREICECVMKEAKDASAKIKLIGGWAVYYSSPIEEDSLKFLERQFGDVDFVALRKEKKKIYNVFSRCGLTPDERFNTLNGDTRLLFYKGNEPIDVFLDVFDMCHRIDLRGSLNVNAAYIPVDDILFTKLQIIEINEKDIKDAIRLLATHELVESDGHYDNIHTSYFTNLCSSDWGIYKTLTSNFAKVQTFIKGLDLDESEKNQIMNKIQTIVEKVENSKKSVKWVMRSKIGERVRWYTLPEEKKHE